MGRRSREKRERHERGLAPAEPRARLDARRRAFVVAAIVAAIVGFGAGWVVRTWLDRTPESAAGEARVKVRERVLEKAR
jgi:hypothetical protein